MEIRRILKMPISQIWSSMRFNEKTPTNPFTTNNISLHVTPLHHIIKNPPSYEATMKFLGLPSHTKVKAFAELLADLGVKELKLNLPANMRQEILEKNKFLAVLDNYAAESLRIERIVLTFRSSEEWLIEPISPEYLQNYTVNHRERNTLIDRIANILTQVKNPFTDKPFLDKNLIEKMTLDERSTLDGAILDALKMFKWTYMEEAQPEGAVGPIECRRILTVHLGFMLSQLIKPRTNKPYLDPVKFDDMPLHQHVVMGFGSSNPIYEAFKDFLRVNESAYHILTEVNYQRVWLRSLQSDFPSH